MPWSRGSRATARRGGGAPADGAAPLYAQLAGLLQLLLLMHDLAEMVDRLAQDP